MLLSGILFQYYLKASDIGRNRAEASFERLAELNDSVTCHLSKDPLSENFVKQFEVCVSTLICMF